MCWAPSDVGFIRFDTSRYAASTQIIEALTEGKPVALPESRQPIVISRGSDEVQGSDMDDEADPLENPDRYEAPQTAAAMPMPKNSPLLCRNRGLILLRRLTKRPRNLGRNGN